MGLSQYLFVAKKGAARALVTLEKKEKLLEDAGSLVSDLVQNYITQHKIVNKEDDIFASFENYIITYIRRLLHDIYIIHTDKSDDELLQEYDYIIEGIALCSDQHHYFDKIISAIRKHAPSDELIESLKKYNTASLEYYETLDRYKSHLEEVASWRKANAIHGWFTRHLMFRELPDTESYMFSGKILSKLAEDCKTVLDAIKPILKFKEILTKGDPGYDVARRLLPPTKGFFFGGTDIDRYYAEELEETIEIIKKLNLRESYIYAASY